MTKYPEGYYWVEIFGTYPFVEVVYKNDLGQWESFNGRFFNPQDNGGKFKVISRIPEPYL